MGVFGSKPNNTPSTKTLEVLRKARVEFNDYLDSLQSNTDADIERKALTPETGSLIYATIQETIKWLKDNPNANINELLTKRDDITKKINVYIKTNTPKQQYYNTLIGLPPIIQQLVDQKLTTADKQTAFMPIINTGKVWYDKNKATLSKTDLSQEFQKIKDNITSTFTDSNVINIINNSINNFSKMETSQLNTLIAQQEGAKKKQEEQNIDAATLGSTVLSTATSVFFGLIIFLFFILCGSLAANIAIGRAPAYRILYFIYGAIPIFSPFVIFYSIIKAISKEGLKLYTVLPISVIPATTRVGKVLWAPFYWIPDSHAQTEYDTYMASIPLQVA